MNHCVHGTFPWKRTENLNSVVILKIGRVRSIVNYDIFYGIFLRGFANICAVSNSVIYDRALLW